MLTVSGRTPRVVLVTPTGGALRDLEEQLGGLGLTLEHADDTELAELLATGGVDLVLCDLSQARPALANALADAPAAVRAAGHMPPEFVLLGPAEQLGGMADAFGNGWYHFVATPATHALLGRSLARACELRTLRDRVRSLETSQEEVVLRSVHDLTANLGLEGTLNSVLRAAELLVRPYSVAAWLAVGPEGQLAPAAVAQLEEGPLTEAHQEVARQAWEQNHCVYGAVGDVHHAALPIHVDGHIEGVLSASFSRGAALLDGIDTHNVLEALAQHAGQAVKKDRLYADLERSSAKISSLFEVGLAMSSETSLQQLFEVVVDSASEICAARRCSLMLIDEDRTTMRMRAARGIPGEVVKVATATVGEGIAGGVAASGKALLVCDIEKDQRFARKNQSQYHNSSLVSVPILVNNRVVGVLNVNDKKDGTSFNENDLNLLVLLASQAAVAIDNANRYQDLSERAVTDSLTGAYVRRFFDESLDRAFRSARTTGRGFSLLMIDIDHFKSVNDTYGHQVGDEALRAVAGVLRGTVRDEDNVSRYGGEEFAVILARASLATALSVSERIRAAVERQDIPHETGTFRVTVSIGVASFGEQFEKAGQVVAAADKALYTAKETGRNRVVSSPTEI